MKISVHILSSLFTLLLLIGCSMTDRAATDQPRKQVYVDANLLFEISYPEEWSRSMQPVTLQPFSKETTTWSIDRKNGQEVRLKLSVLSRPAKQNPLGYDGLLTHLREQHDAFTITATEEITLPAGPGIKIYGKTPQDLFEIWLYLGEERHYIISGSAATPAFAQHRLQFREIAESFKIVK